MKCSKCNKEIDSLICPDCGVTADGITKKKFIGLIVGIAILSLFIPILLALIVIFIIPTLTSNKEALKRDCCAKYKGTYESGECIINGSVNEDYWDTKTNECLFEEE